MRILNIGQMYGSTAVVQQAVKLSIEIEKSEKTPLNSGMKYSNWLLACHNHFSQFYCCWWYFFCFYTYFHIWTEIWWVCVCIFEFDQMLRKKERIQTSHTLCVHKIQLRINATIERNTHIYSMWKERVCKQGTYNGNLLPHHEGSYKLNAKQGRATLTTNSNCQEKKKMKKMVKLTHMFVYMCVCTTRTDGEVLCSFAADATADNKSKVWKSCAQNIFQKWSRRWKK